MVSTRYASPFGGAFWCAYAANTALMIAVSLMFRYSDFVRYLGGSEYQLGWIVGIGMIGAVAMRLLQGGCVDRYGAGNMWLLSEVGVILSLVGHLGIDRLDSFSLYGLRMLYATSLAGAFGASIVFVSLRAPADRIGETIGALGSSGFVGMAVGPMIADYLFTLPGGGRVPIDRMFLTAIAATALAIGATAAARFLAGPHRRTTRRSVPIWWLLRRYHPGPILIVGIAMGLGINIPFSFLRPFTERVGISGIQTFFVMYSAVAFLTRVFGRRLPDRWGVRQTVTLGMSFLCLHLLAFLVVRTEWGLLVPATLGGVAHAFVFPAAMAAASVSFPNRYRGLATAWMLTMIDLGSVLGQPAVGSLLRVAEDLKMAPYPTTFVVITVGLSLATLWYAFRSRTDKLPKDVCQVLDDVALQFGTTSLGSVEPISDEPVISGRVDAEEVSTEVHPVELAVRDPVSSIEVSAAKLSPGSTQAATR